MRARTKHDLLICSQGVFKRDTFLFLVVSFDPKMVYLELPNSCVYENSYLKKNSAISPTDNCFIP